MSESNEFVREELKEEQKSNKSLKKSRELKKSQKSKKSEELPPGVRES